MVGPTLRNFISTTLRRSRVPRLLGYDPVMQFLHERDAVEALRLAATRPGMGVYNVAGEGAVAWSWAIRHAGARYVSVPHVLAIPVMALAFRARGVTLPEHLIDYFRYPVIIDDRRFREDFGYQPTYDTVAALRAVRGLA
jgi:UDP-glucose 4-epimerase